VSDQPNYIHWIGRFVQDKHDFKNQARITGFRKKNKKVYLQLKLGSLRKRWYLADTVFTHWDIV
jgi:phosphate-selective porin